jgi:hypothetical protein
VSREVGGGDEKDCGGEQGRRTDLPGGGSGTLCAGASGPCDGGGGNSVGHYLHK